jgi:hypothetical protein
MSKPTVAEQDAREISSRLKQFARRFGGWTGFQRRFDIPRVTRVDWARKKNPSVPQVPYLLRLAREGRLSVDWLLLGEGPELLGTVTSSDAGTVLRSAVVSELKVSAQASDEEIEAILPSSRRLYEDITHGYHARILHYRELHRKEGCDDKVQKALLRERLRLIAALTPGVLTGLNHPPQLLGPFLHRLEEPASEPGNEEEPDEID